MTTKDSAQMSANEATHQYLISDAATEVISNDNAVSSMVDLFDKNRLASIKSATAAGVDNKGFSQDKLDAKFEMSFQAACLAGSAQVKLESLGKNSIARQMHSAETYYMQAADSEASTEVRALHDLLVDNLSVLTPDYVSAAQLLDLQSLITVFMTTQGSSAAVHRISPELTQVFNNDLAACKKNGVDLKKLIKKYKKSNNLFYKSVVDVMKPKNTVHHTDIDLLVIDALTELPIKDAVATFSDSAKTGISKEDGSLLVEEIFHGEKTMTVISTDHLPSVTTVNIISGKTNSFKIMLTPMDI